MAVSIASSAKSGECPARAVAPASEGQRAPGLIIHPVSLGEPCGMVRSVLPVRAQEQDVGKLGQHAMRAPTRGWLGALLNRRAALALIVVYLTATSMNKLAPVASRAICWASAWHEPVLSAGTLWHALHGPGVGKLSGCGQVPACSYTGMSYVRVLQQLSCRVCKQSSGM